MATYVTVADIDGEIGSGWAGEQSKEMHVKVVNAWLTSVIKRSLKVVPHEVVQAAGLVAPLAAAGTLFSATGVELTSKSVEAGGVKSSKSYKSGSVSRTAEENTAMALLLDIASSNAITVAKLRIV